MGMVLIYKYLESFLVKLLLENCKYRQKVNIINVGKFCFQEEDYEKSYSIIIIRSNIESIVMRLQGDINYGKEIR